MTLTRKKFKPAVSVRDTMSDDPSRSRKALSSAAKKKVKEEDDYERLTRLTSLEKQGQMLAVSADEEAKVWGKTVQTIPAEQMQFVLNAAVDILPHNANLQLWRKESDTCPLCGERQTLVHVLNWCRVVRDPEEVQPAS